MKKKLSCGTRGSALALTQTDEVIDLLEKKYHGLEIEKIIIKTQGDLFKDRAISEFKGVGVFVKELDEKILANEIEFSVNSLKDVPVELPSELCIAAVLKRANPNDVLISRFNIERLPYKAIIGTSSMRRKALLLHLRNDLKIEDLRGNVPTRIKKWKAGTYDGIIVAKAGMDRLGIEVKNEIIDPEIFPTSAGQGAIAIITKKQTETEKIINSIEHPETRIECDVERLILKTLGAGCIAPLGVNAKIDENEIYVNIAVLSVDGKQSIFTKRKIKTNDYKQQAIDLANEVKISGGGILIEKARK